MFDPTPGQWWADTLNCVFAGDEDNPTLVANFRNSRTANAAHKSQQASNAALCVLAKDMLWLLKHKDRHQRINAERDAGNNVASVEKEFVARYEKLELEVFQKLGVV